MASFQAKIGRKRLRKREYKNYHSVTQVGKGREREIIKLSFRFVPTRLVIENYNKIAKKFKKLRKLPLWLQFKQKKVGKGREREKIKIIVPFRSYPTGQENSKKIAKKF